eukprot:scaffold93338_cov57-Phaeocystis_antarctica.AAC.1
MMCGPAQMWLLHDHESRRELEVEHRGRGELRQRTNLRPTRSTMLLHASKLRRSSARLLFADLGRGACSPSCASFPRRASPPPPPELAPPHHDHHQTTRPAPLPHLAPGSPPRPPRPPRQRRRRQHRRPSAAALLPPFLPPPEPPAIARGTARPPRRWRSSPGAPSCHRVSPAPGRAWDSQGWRGTRRSSPSYC